MVIHQPLAGQLPFAKKVTIITHENDDRVVVQACLCQPVSNLGDFEIDAGEHAVIALDTVLVLLRRIVAPVPAFAVESFSNRLRQALEILIVTQRRTWHRHVLVKMRHLVLPEILLL